jgi:hypothetical protein
MEKTANQEELNALKASKGKRAQCSEERASKMQHSERSINTHRQPIRDSNSAVGPAERDSEECAFPEEDNRFLLRQFPNPWQVLKKVPLQVLTGTIHVRRKHNKK